MWRSKFRFDVYRAGTSRWQWIHKQEEEFHGVSDVRSYSMPVTPISVGDIAEISIPMYSLMGAVDINSIEWQSLLTERLPD